ncbi:MAG: AAA family ATPase, partial [Anaerolineae bacterium]|nr:AAA family ATPase [Anaerolineae bacterium]
FERGPVFRHLLLVDEVNRTTPKTQSALLEVMQEHAVSVGGERLALPLPFFVMATQNPLEMEGTYPLPEAQLDRFMFKVNVRYPTPEQLVTILGRTTGADVPTVEIAADSGAILGMRDLVLQMPAPTQVSEYVARLVVATQPESGSHSDLVMRYVRYGSSPRGAQAIMLGAKAWAMLEGRFNVSFDDVRAVAPAACGTVCC